MKTMRNGLVGAMVLMLIASLPVSAQDSSIIVQCPTGTILHPDTDGDDMTREDGIECIHLAAGDGMVTMADDMAKTQYIFSFAKLDLPGENGAPTEASGEYPGWVMDQGMLAANAPAPTISVDEDDELFLSLTNVGMVMRPDLFDPHTVHWHGFPQASAIFDGVPDASVSVNMGASLSYYYKAQDAGTYMYHCHVEATEHMQMGMLGNLWVRPRQNKLPDGQPCWTDSSATAILTPGAGDDSQWWATEYAYNDGDASTRYDVEYPDPDRLVRPRLITTPVSNVQPLPFAAHEVIATSC